ncbi:MAG: aminotransferase class V-fold PLP-dependent enzyme [Fimbriimonadales bacterium]|nr:aminotransferase class V-fold PLP-dependent enzyme [Fimbriimonadales bacterium]MDW8052722.1 aminotransferase class V-fold PLP-dependent enzyme [Armatimonadota bacterium]
MAGSPLDFDPETMRQMGYRVVDTLVAYWQSLPARPIGTRPAPAMLEALLNEPTPTTPQPFEQVLNEFLEKVLPHIIKVDHPRYFAFVPAPNDYVGVLADFLAAGMNIFVGTWMVGAGASQVERVVIRWLCDWFDLPETAGGLFVSGGSVANLVCLAAARQRYPDALTRGRVYYSDQTHSCVARAWRILGLREEQLCVLPADEQFQIPLEALRKQIQRDRADGWQPFCVVANAGTTNTGAVDPLEALADLCAEEGLWLHADGAYGAAAILTEEGKRRLRGIHRLDSLAVDPHKWLYQPMMAGCALVRDFEHLRAAFRILPPYLQDKERGATGVDFCDYGVELSRSFRALKVWMALKVRGVDAFRQAMEWNLHLARVAEQALRQLPHWQIVSPATMGIVAFRYAPPTLSEGQADALNRALVDKMIEDGFGMVSSTILRGRVTLRMCTLNPRATEEDVRETVRRLHQFATA